MSVLNFIPAKLLVPATQFPGGVLFSTLRLIKNKLFFQHKLHSRKQVGILLSNDFQLPNRFKLQGFQRKYSTSNASAKCQSTFQDEMSLRKNQADRSILIELTSKKEIPCVIASCGQCGVVKTAFCYSGESKNVFLFLEFEDNDCLQKLLSSCQYPNLSDAIPTTSRIIQFSKKYHRESYPSSSIQVIEDISNVVSSKGVKSVSKIIEDHYQSEKLSELNIRLRFFFCSLVKDAISGIFPHCDVLPFGSSINGVGKQGCDLDIMIREYPAKMVEESEFSFLNKTCIGNSRELQKKSIYALGEFIGAFVPGVYSMKKIVHARVPIMKFTHKIIGMECDISVNNMSAVLMSELLFFCGEIDPRVRPLIYAVKKWAREANVTYEAPGSWITNFALTLLAVHFLQNRPVPVLPPLCDAVEIVGAENTTHFAIEYLSPLSDLQSQASLNKESLAVLLLEFLTFLASHPFKDRHISLLSGQSTPHPSAYPIWVQYPLEEDLNVTKNVAPAELRDACEKARLSAAHLSSHIAGGKGGNAAVPPPQHLHLLLGIPALGKVFAHKTKRLDVGALFQDDVRKKSKRRTF